MSQTRVMDTGNTLTLTSGHFAFLIAWAIVAVLVGWCITFWIIRKSPASVGMALKDGLLPKLLTIILVLLASTILALTDKLTEAPAAILSGVVGYVLGTTSSERSRGPHDRGKEHDLPDEERG